MKLEEVEFDGLILPLQEWFLKNARVLPWRSDPTPYHVWVSEIMLQQTRVEAVKRYYERFIQELPDLKSLAECTEEKYLKLWEGLGYYSRVRNLHEAACQIEEMHKGIFPEEEKEILALKGIGSYTAGAILSIAFQKPVPAVDGNVLRVLMRLAGDDSDIAEGSTKKRTESVLRALMEKHPKGSGENAIDPRIFSQALMELGALVCLPNGLPICKSCPFEGACQARKENLIERLPRKKKAKGRRIEKRTVLLLKEDALVAIRKRPGKGLLAGLYELPNLEGNCSESEIVAYVRKLGLEPIRIKMLEESKHIFSHVEWHMTGYEVFLEGREEPFGEKVRKKEGLFFVNKEEMKEKYAIPTAFQAYRKYIMES